MVDLSCISTIFRKAWLNLKSLIRQLMEEYTEIREVEKRIVLQNGGSIQIKSANKPESLRGSWWYFISDL